MAHTEFQLRVRESFRVRFGKETYQDKDSKGRLRLTHLGRYPGGNMAEAQNIAALFGLKVRKVTKLRQEPGFTVLIPKTEEEARNPPPRAKPRQKTSRQAEALAAVKGFQYTKAKAEYKDDGSIRVTVMFYKEERFDYTKPGHREMRDRWMARNALREGIMKKVLDMALDHGCEVKAEEGWTHVYVTIPA